MYEDLAKELKRNTQIIQSTFNAFNLQVLQVGYHPYGVEDDSEESDADCDCLVEVSALNDGPMTHDAYLKVNLYDENGDLISHDYSLIQAEGFSGYDTYKVMLINDSKTLRIAKSAKVYMSQNS